MPSSLSTHDTPIAAFPAANGDVWICVDLTKLNMSVKREIYTMPTVEETLSKIAEGNVFSKLDVNSGFRQIKLDGDSSKLTPFITPYRRYRFKRLPYGITSVPEYFQKKMDNILHGLQGVVCHIDDILIFGKDKYEHDARLKKVLGRLSQSGLTLNPEKFEFYERQVDYLGQVIDAEGVKNDPAKVKAILDRKDPESVPDVRRILGMVNQLMKFVPNLAEKSKPERNLLRKGVSWTRGKDQQDAFNSLKMDLASPETSPERELWFQRGSLSAATRKWQATT